ncbi:MAG: glycosyltransferase, partial [Quisquiliibacterium sp.]
AAALRDAGHQVLLVSPPGEYGARLQALGFRWLPAPMERLSLNPVKELALVRWLTQLVRREQIDLVHGFTIKCAVYGSLAARLSRRAVRVNAVAGMGYVFTSNDLKARLLRPVVRSLMRIALDGERARLILQNPDDVALFERARLVHPARVRLIKGSGVDCSRFAPTAPKALAKPFRVLLAARLLWDKGLAEYVQAAQVLKAQGRDVEFLLAGEPDLGNPASVPAATVNQWVNEGLINWLGHVEDMPALLGSVHA